MKEDEFPALYKSADSLSKKSQSRFFGLLAGNLVLLVAATFATEIVRDEQTAAVLLLLFLLASIGCAGALAWFTPQQKWYNARALTESIKTVTWRFVTKSEPYDNDASAQQLLISNLRKLLEDNSSLPLSASDGEQITTRMIDMRRKPWTERRGFYISERIDDQLSWYTRKSDQNSRSAMRWYSAVILLHILAIAALVMTVWKDWGELWAVNILLTIAACSMAWLQTKRYQELAASYALTAHDIGLLKSELSGISKESDFSSYVGDAENAFSREHTQWRARRDMN